MTGGVYKTRLHLHRSVLIYDYSQFLLHVFVFQKTIRTTDNFFRFAHAHAIAPICSYLCSTCIAQSIKAIMTWRHPNWWILTLRTNICYKILQSTIIAKGCARYRKNIPDILRHELTTAMQHLYNFIHTVANRWHWYVILKLRMHLCACRVTCLCILVGELLALHIQCSTTWSNMQGLVRLLALYRIKSHAPLLVTGPRQFL